MLLDDIKAADASKAEVQVRTAQPTAPVATEGCGCAPKTPWQVIASRAVAEPDVTRHLGRRYGPLARHVYDLFEPPERMSCVATALFIYGGSWETGERGCYSFVGSGLAMRGIRTIVADYRLYPEVSFPGFVDDAALAFAHVADRYGQPNGRAPVVIGHSAGAHIAALLAGNPDYLAQVKPGSKRPAAFVGISGPYIFDPTTWETTKHIFTTVAQTPDAARPVTFVRADYPPTLLLHGGRDRLVTAEASRAMCEALDQVGASARCKVYPHLAHAGPITTMARPLRWLAPTLRDVAEFVKAHG